MARPKKTLNDLPKGWQQTIIDIMSQGGSKVEVKAKLSISNDLFERLVDEEPLFSDTVKKGEQLSQAWWEQKARLNLENRDFNATLWYMNMKNRFGWRDKQDIEHSNNPANPLSIVLIDGGQNPYKTNAQN